MFMDRNILINSTEKQVPRSYVSKSKTNVLNKVINKIKNVDMEYVKNVVI